MRNYSEEQFDAINNSINDSEELVHAVSDPKSDPSINPKVATYTTNDKFTQKLLIGRFVAKIIPAAICPVDQLVTEDPLGIRDILGSCQTVLPKAIVTDAASCGARIYGL